MANFDHINTLILVRVISHPLRVLALQVSDMEAQKSQPEIKPSVPVATSASSCRKKKSEEAAFLEDLKDHIDEFIHASMDEHKECFKKTVQKMFTMSKKVAEKNSEQQEVESVLPLQTSISN